MEIVKAQLGSKYAKGLIKLLRSEWHDLPEFQICENGVSLPCPLAALVNGNIVGGSSFAGYKAPGSDEAALWINTVYVVSHKRKNGLASNLITSMVKHAKKVGHFDIYALTDIPNMYHKLGWSTVKVMKDGTVVTFRSST